MADKQTVDSILESLEQGLKDMFNSEKYVQFLSTMSKFHNYSFNNTLLIAMQRPDASLVAGYNSWQKNFGRQVNKGEKGIKILAPAPYKKQLEREKIDPDTKKPLIGDDGHTVKEYVEVTVPAFKPVTVFDVAQTSGREIPSLGVEELDGSVKGYIDFKTALEAVSPVPIIEMQIESGAKGYFSPSEQQIALQSGMSEIQSIKTMIHEIAHAFLHDKDGPKIEGLSADDKKSRSNKEVEAESVAYTVCQHFGIDTSEYSFGYVAGWSSGKELTELKESMDTIKKTASALISGIEDKILELTKDRSKELPREASVTASPSEDSRPENYLKNAEMATEQNMNMIDQSINNVAPDDESDLKILPKEEKKETIKDQMKRLKDKVDAECSHKEKVPVKGKEIDTDGK